MLLTYSDQSELERLVVEAAWRVDHGQPDRLHELFTDDATLHLGPDAMEGREQIEEWGVQRARVERVTRHVCTNMRFDLIDSDTAAGTTTFSVYWTGDDATTPRVVGDYEDRFVRMSQGWRFAERRARPVFVRTT